MEHLPIEEKKYWLAYSQNEKINWPIIKLLVKAFGSLERSWNRTDGLVDLELTHSEKEEIKRVWLDYQPDRIVRETEKAGVEAVTIIEESFPKLLGQISDPPFLLFYCGQLPSSKEICLASVGTRKATLYGLRSVRELIRPVAKRGVVIVSGLAYGIDQASHQATLSVKGKTIAVLGNGLDNPSIYPSSNQRLALEIVKNNGCLISEYPVDIGPQKHFFVARNRIIAGLSQASLIVEAPEKSGALITAEFALEEGREVLAVPGSIDRDNSQGVNRLIKEGAMPVSNAQEILELLNLP